MRYLAKQFNELGAAERDEVIAFLNELDDHDDVQRVFAAIK
jgi:transcriptional/translational regulatory protein YebC/TACO1